MTRIVGGTAGGRPLKVPTGGTRPTSEMVREAVASALVALDAVTDVAVLDLYAGSGAMGLELLSRGAASAVLVEKAAKAAAIAKANAATLSMPATVVAADVVTYVSQPADATFDVIYIDPPYDVTTATVERVVTLLVDNGWLADQAVVIVERRSKDGGITWPPGLRAYRDKKYGDTGVHYALADASQ